MLKKCWEAMNKKGEYDPEAANLKDCYVNTVRVIFEKAGLT
jgi:hypothetical protein